MRNIPKCDAADKNNSTETIDVGNIIKLHCLISNFQLENAILSRRHHYW